MIQLCTGQINVFVITLQDVTSTSNTLKDTEDSHTLEPGTVTSEIIGQQELTTAKDILQLINLDHNYARSTSILYKCG